MFRFGQPETKIMSGALGVLRKRAASPASTDRCTKASADEIQNRGQNETSAARFNELEASRIAPCGQNAADNIQNLPVALRAFTRSALQRFLFARH
jgi:hypothetical protein